MPRAASPVQGRFEAASRAASGAGGGHSRASFCCRRRGDGARPRFGRICRLTVRRLTIRRSQEPHRQARPGRAGSRMTRTRTETRNSGGGRNARMHARTRTHLRLSSATPRLRSSPPPPLLPLLKPPPPVRPPPPPAFSPVHWSVPAEYSPPTPLPRTMRWREGEARAKGGECGSTSERVVLLHGTSDAEGESWCAYLRCVFRAHRSKIHRATKVA